MTLMDLIADKPDELLRMSMIRGHCMEQMGQPCRLTQRPDEIFLTGMFSLIDVLMDKSMETALAGMALSPAVCAPLLEHKGPLYDLLQLVVSLERGAWDETDKLALQLGVGTALVRDTYIDAVQKCDELFM